MRPFTRALLTVAAAMLGFAALATSQDSYAATDALLSISALFDRIADLPANAAEAAMGVAKLGRGIPPRLLALAADVRAWRRALLNLTRP